MLCVPYVPTWSNTNVPMCQRAKKRVNFSFLLANVPINVPSCQRHTKDVPKACQLLIFTCNRSNKRANVPKASQRRTNFSKLACQLDKRRAIFFNLACQKVCQLFNYFSKGLYFFIYKIYLYLIYFI